MFIAFFLPILWLPFPLLSSTTHHLTVSYNNLPPPPPVLSRQNIIVSSVLADQFFAPFILFVLFFSIIFGHNSQPSAGNYGHVRDMSLLEPFTFFTTGLKISTVYNHSNQDIRFSSTLQTLLSYPVYPTCHLLSSILCHHPPPQFHLFLTRFVTNSPPTLTFYTSTHLS
jgi:hypothetical protein